MLNHEPVDTLWLRYLLTAPSEALAATNPSTLTGLYRPFYHAAHTLSLDALDPTPGVLWDCLTDVERQGFPGGLEWLSGLTEPSASDVRYTQKKLAEKAIRLLYADQVDGLQKLLLSGAENDALRSYLLESNLNIENGLLELDWLDYEGIMGNARRSALSYFNSATRLYTGISQIDQMFGSVGIREGSLLVIGAYPSHGKSIGAQMLAEGIVREHTRREPERPMFAHFEDTEMGLDAVVERIFQRASGKSYAQYPNLDAAQKVINDHASDVRRAGLMVGSSPTPTLGAILQHSLRSVSKGARIIVWDGATNIDCGAKGEGSERTNLVRLTRTAKQFAKQHRVLVILTGQLLQDVQPKSGLPRRPRREEFKGSRSFTEDADYALLVRRVDLHPCVEDLQTYNVDAGDELRTIQGLSHFELAKNRYGNWGPQICTSLTYLGYKLKYQEEN